MMERKDQNKTSGKTNSKPLKLGKARRKSALENERKSSFLEEGIRLLAGIANKGHPRYAD